MKQLATYSDCYEAGLWSEPDSVVDKLTAEYTVRTAELLLSPHVVTPREIELWTACVGPVWKQDMETMKAAVAEWYSRMEREGLFPEGPQGMNTFLWPTSDLSSQDNQDDA